jgi:hypothetical protein
MKLRARTLAPQCSPCDLASLSVNRSGDFVRSRGETRDQSTAENPRYLIRLSPLFVKRLNVFVR